MQDELKLEQFRVEVATSGVVHLIFDMPGRSMNVFSNAAIHDLGTFASWIKRSSHRGVVVSSGKSSAFCAGADLGELGQAYDMILTKSPALRFQTAYDHFFPLSRAIRALESCGKPVAVAVGGLALGGGCELALGAHYRVAADSPRVAFGLPESLVGLLPGAGGTQRLPRVAGLKRSLPILLEGTRLSVQEAVEAGLVHETVAPGDEIIAAERWVLTTKKIGQPWDVPGWKPADINALPDIISTRRQQVLAETLGHYPAPLAILNCLEYGYPQPIDVAIRTEMEIFSGLIQRPEPRDMIATMFMSKIDYERRAKAGLLPEAVGRVAEALSALWKSRASATPLIEKALIAAGFTKLDGSAPLLTSNAERSGYWFDCAPEDEGKRAVKGILEDIRRHALKYETELDANDKGLVDYALVAQHGFPAYLGGAYAMLASRRKLSIEN